MKTRILVVAPYPIKNPMHGGQKRTHALVTRYRQISNNVSFVAVFLENAFKDGDVYKSDIKISNSITYDRLRAHPEQTDIINGLALTEDSVSKFLFIKLIKGKNPDVIHIEQPYLVQPIVDILKEINMKCVIIFGSQNVESEMKHDIFKTTLSKSKLKKLVDETEKIERNAVEKANLVIGVSQYDVHLLTQTIKFKPSFVIPNGIEAPAKHVLKSNEWATFKKDRDIKSMAVFIGSAHPPNYLGFLKLIAPIQNIDKTITVVAGGVSKLIAKEYEGQNQIWKNVFAAGLLSNTSLQSLIYESDIILLPILNGGGSNLKTAEAIISGKKIVATEYAFRGYERYLALPNIFIANSPKAYEKALHTALRANVIPLSNEQKKLSRSVTWGYKLNNLKNVLLCAYFLMLFNKIKILKL